MNKGSHKMSVIKITEFRQPQTKAEEKKALQTIKQMKLEHAYQAARLASSFQRHRADEDLCEAV